LQPVSSSASPSFFLASIVAVPLLGLGGCKFMINAFISPCDGANIHVVASKDIDLSQVACIRGMVSGATSDQGAFPKPDAGWPSDVGGRLCFQRGRQGRHHDHGVRRAGASSASARARR